MRVFLITHTYLCNLDILTITILTILRLETMLCYVQCLEPPNASAATELDGVCHLCAFLAPFFASVAMHTPRAVTTKASHF